MKAKLTLTKVEVEAMVAANIAGTWPCIPGHHWEATMDRYDERVNVEAVSDAKPDDRQEEHGVQL